MPPIRKKYIPKGWTPERETDVPMTAEGIERMRSRLARLKRDLPALALEAQRTAAFGDRSENAAYQTAKRDLRRAQGQIVRLEALLKHVAPLPAGPDAAGAVRLGATVVLETSDGTQKTYRIVSARETDPARGRLSTASPLGAALLGKKSGDQLIIETPGGKQGYRIVEII